MKWLLIFIIMSMDTPIYLEFEDKFMCVEAGVTMQKQFTGNTNQENIAPPYNTFACVEQN